MGIKPTKKCAYDTQVRSPQAEIHYRFIWALFPCKNRACANPPPGFRGWGSGQPCLSNEVAHHRAATLQIDNTDVGRDEIPWICYEVLPGDVLPPHPPGKGIPLISGLLNYVNQTGRPWTLTLFRYVEPLKSTHFLSGCFNFCINLLGCMEVIGLDCNVSHVVL